MCDQPRQQQQALCGPSHGARHTLLLLLLLVPGQVSLLHQRRLQLLQLLRSLHMQANLLCRQQGSSHTAA
jgi:hypothetical protein